jgi:hypothetical protein
LWSHAANAQHRPLRHAPSLKQSADVEQVSPGMDFVVQSPVVLSQGFVHPAAFASLLQQ